MKKFLSVLLSAVMAAALLGGCGSADQKQASPTVEEPSAESSTTAEAAPAPEKAETASGEKKQISLWFWSAPVDQQVLLKQIIEDDINAVQDDYVLNIEFHAGNDQNIATALAANSGPDIVFTSGPSYVTNYASAGKLENLDRYAEKYGWNDRLLEPIYNLGTYKGSLYGLSNSLMIMGVFYNKKVLADNGWEVPKTIEEMETIMKAAQEKGLYGSVTGNKGWKPVNDNYSSLFLNYIAGPEKVYECLKGETKWNNPDMVEALNKSAEWYQNGWLGGDNYTDLNFDESVQLLSMGMAPFFVGPSNVFQWAPKYFRGLTEDDFGFFPFPATNDKVNYPTYTLGVTSCLSINAFSPYKDECAEILDKIMTNEFMVKLTKEWPGYWAIPLKQYDIPADTMTGISAVFCDVMIDTLKAIDEGNYGYYTMSFCPPATDVALQDIDGVWLGTMSAEEVLDRTDAEFEKELANGLVVPLPER